MIKKRLTSINRKFCAGAICMFMVSNCFAKTLIDYFLPMPIVEPLRSDVWGSRLVGKRDVGNGLEDVTNKSYAYWDGPIIKGPDGKYHMFASRWGQAGGHWAWMGSLGVHAVSDSVMGPYIDKGLTWPHNGDGKGHNLTILQLKDETYASVVSDIRQGDFFTAPTLDGPWTFAGTIKIDANGFGKPNHLANLSIIIRPDDGQYMIIERNGQIMTSDNLVGPYKIRGKSIYSGLAPNLEDPVLWYSGGYYHVVVNSWSEKKAFHLRSKDGISGWTNEGVAFDPRSDFLRYTDGTVNHWAKIERPGVFIQNGHITHWTFAVIDSEKEDDLGNDDHNSKVIVVPFDGVAFDGEIVPESRDTVYNGKFDVGTSGWTLNVWGGKATGTIADGEYKTEISEIGTVNHEIQLVQSGLILERDNFYKVSFSAHASVNRPLEVNVEMKDDPWTSYLAEPEEFDLTTSKETCSFTFKMENPTDSTGRLSFNMGGASGTVFLDDISIALADSTPAKHTVIKLANLMPVVNCHGSVLKIEINSGVDKQVTVGVYDLRGNFRRIRTEKYNFGNRQILTSDISAFPKGMYVVGLIRDGKTIHKAKFLNH